MLARTCQRKSVLPLPVVDSVRYLQKHVKRLRGLAHLAETNSGLRGEIFLLPCSAGTCTARCTCKTSCSGSSNLSVVSAEQPGRLGGEHEDVVNGLELPGRAEFEEDSVRRNDVHVRVECAHLPNTITFGCPQNYNK